MSSDVPLSRAIYFFITRQKGNITSTGLNNIVDLNSYKEAKEISVKKQYLGKSRAHV